jgi:hypothetical protein
MFRGLKDTFGRMTDVQTAVQALHEAELFRTQVGEFGTDMARQIRVTRSVNDNKYKQEEKAKQLDQ